MEILKSKVIKNEIVSNNIYMLEVDYQYNGEIKPGQFFMLKTLDNSFLLPRPISVHDVINNRLFFLYRIEGKGTYQISSIRENEYIQAFGPLGNGFNINELKGKTAIIGGGIGTAPLFLLAKKLNKKVDVYLGFRDDVYNVEKFKEVSNNVVIATENGSLGHKGFVTDLVNYELYDNIVTCGPEIMMKKIIEKCRGKIKCYVSLERRMACGMGVCLGCVVETIHGNKRACKEGPVFSIDELI